MDVAGSMNIMFKADPSHLCDHRPSVLYWVIQPGSSIGGVGAGVIRMVRPWNEWLIVWGYDINDEPPVVDDEAAATIARNLIGESDPDIEILGPPMCGVNDMSATSLPKGRVFCGGDDHPPHTPGTG